LAHHHRLLAVARIMTKHVLSATWTLDSIYVDNSENFAHIISVVKLTKRSNGARHGHHGTARARKRGDPAQDLDAARSSSRPRVREVTMRRIAEAIEYSPTTSTCTSRTRTTSSARSATPISAACSRRWSSPRRRPSRSRPSDNSAGLLRVRPPVPNQYVHVHDPGRQEEKLDEGNRAISPSATCSTGEAGDRGGAVPRDRAGDRRQVMWMGVHGVAARSSPCRAHWPHGPGRATSWTR